MSREKIEKNLEKLARELLNLSGNCAQTSFAVLQEHFDLKSEGILKALTPFPGLVLRGEVCGAVVGSLMALGLIYGREDLGNRRGSLVSFSYARKFCTSFEKEYGCTSCAQILTNKMGKSFNLADSKSSKEYLQAGGQNICAGIVANSVLIATSLINNYSLKERSSNE